MDKRKLEGAGNKFLAEQQIHKIRLYISCEKSGALYPGLMAGRRWHSLTRVHMGSGPGITSLGPGIKNDKSTRFI